MCSLQQQTTALRAQQQKREEKVEDLQEEAKRVTVLIHPMHQKLHGIVASVESNMLEHVTFDLVEHMQKVEEEVRTSKEKLLKILEDFQNKLCASQFMEL